MTINRHTNIIASYLALLKKGQVLLLRRCNTHYHDGDYSLVARHVDPEETFTQCIMREAKEEAGIILLQSDLQVSHIMHRKSKTDKSERVDVFFTATKWQGEVRNIEPEKCSQLAWFDLANLPTNTIPCVQTALNHIQNGVFYSEFGWE